LTLNDSTNHAMGLDVVRGVLGRHPDFSIKRSDSLDRAANAGQPLVSSDPDDPLVADLRRLADLLTTSAAAHIAKAAR
jgi:cellulose biosynthesis protein BcsQ